MTRRNRAIMGVLAVVLMSVGVVGCGSTSTTTVVRTVSQSGSRTPAGSAVSSSAVAQNSAVIAQAAQGADNQAQLGAAAIQEILTKKLGLNPTLDFNLNHQTPPAEGGDCYVALGAAAVNFENMPGNILRSPNGKDVVFVQSDTTTPLAKCLVAVNTALGW